jgi:hypothetical protein
MRLTTTDPTSRPACVKNKELPAQQNAVNNAAASPIHFLSFVLDIER